MLVAYARPLLRRLGSVLFPNEIFDRQAEFETYTLSTMSRNLDHESFSWFSPSHRLICLVVLMGSVEQLVTFSTNHHFASIWQSGMDSSPRVRLSLQRYP